MQCSVTFTALGLISALAVAGCAPTTPVFDKHFGTSVTQLRAQQVVNSDAPIENQARSVEGLDGRAARESMDRYYRSFQEPPKPTNVFTIGVGGGDAGK